MQILPAVDVLDGKVVRLARGRFDRVTVYAADPVHTARAWTQQGAGMVHVVDLTGARAGLPDPSLWHELNDAGIRFQVGGGVRSAGQAVAAIAAGAARVVVGTAAVWNPSALRRMVDAVGPEQLVAAIDVDEGRATGAGWQDRGKSLEQVIRQVVDAGVARALVTGIRRDSTMTGPDLGLLRRVAALAPALKLIGSGGVGSLADISALASQGLEAAIVGRALYEGRFSLSDALAAAS